MRFGIGEVIGDVRSIGFCGGVMDIVDGVKVVEAGTKAGRREAARFLRTGRRDGLSSFVQLPREVPTGISHI